MSEKKITTESIFDMIQAHVENVVLSRLPQEDKYPSHIAEAMNYAMKAGGKRIRPTLMYLTYKACKRGRLYDLSRAEETHVEDGSDTVERTDISDDVTLKLTSGNEDAIESFMAAIEMIHTHSLIHDDLPALDNDSLRRGRPTVHVQFDESTAILAGDALLNYAYELVHNTYIDEMYRGVSNKSFKKDYMLLGRLLVAGYILSAKTGVNGMLGGQGLDVQLSGQNMTNDERDYININKTCALIEAPLMIGATLAGADKGTVNKLEEAGRNIGLAFQVQDDILDVTSDAETLGKEVHQDERNAKNTYVSEYGLDEARKYVRARSENAVKTIEEVVPEGEYRELLIDLINKMTVRVK